MALTWYFPFIVRVDSVWMFSCAVQHTLTCVILNMFFMTSLLQQDVFGWICLSSTWLYVVTQTPHLFLFSSIELLTPAQGTECFVLSGQQTADPAPRRLCLGTVSLYMYRWPVRLFIVMCCHVLRCFCFSSCFVTHQYTDICCCIWVLWVNLVQTFLFQEGKMLWPMGFCV